MIESLEHRRLLHGTGIVNRTLIVEGSEAADRFDVSQNSTQLSLISFDNGIQEPTDRFNLADFDVILFYLGAGNDRVSLTNVTKPTSIDAGKGNDTLEGGAGKDTLKGSAGNDVLNGNNGDDLIDGGAGRDAMNAGTGRDILDYSKRTNAVTVTLGTTADDGETNEFDNASTNFEIIRGGSGNDYLTTTVAKNVTLAGNNGDDTLIGNGGDDALLGGGGLDVMIGNNGNDTFYAADGIIERLDGGAGTDIVKDKDKKDRLVSIP